MPGAAARGWLSLAARSARGGTTGRAAGCPASGRAGGRGADGMGAPGPDGAGELPADGAMGVRAVTPGLKIGTDVDNGSLTPEGIGWRGPDSTCPGRAGGTGLAGDGVGRAGGITAGGWAGVGGGAIRGERVPAAPTDAKCPPTADG